MLRQSLRFSDFESSPSKWTNKPTSRSERELCYLDHSGIIFMLFAYEHPVADTLCDVDTTERRPLYNRFGRRLFFPPWSGAFGPGSACLWPCCGGIASCTPLAATTQLAMRKLLRNRWT
ncbi:hypothetical protein KC349_g81 [Hortaea werneckii]|nr:hypothetical protein KC349_g81 [Hortaea werneckii]